MCQHRDIRLRRRSKSVCGDLHFRLRVACPGASARPGTVASTIDEVWKKSQSLRPQLSTDTTPVTVKVGNVTYQIPRNYISMYFDFPQLKVTYPGFKPFTEETRGCFDRRLEAELGCTTLELNLRLSLPHHPGFENLIKAAPPYRDKPLLPRPGPYGYDIYDQGPDNARTEIYRSESEDIFFTCGIYDKNGVRSGVCDDAVSLSDGNAVRFFFYLRQVSSEISRRASAS